MDPISLTMTIIAQMVKTKTGRRLGRMDILFLVWIDGVVLRASDNVEHKGNKLSSSSCPICMTGRILPLCEWILIHSFSHSVIARSQNDMYGSSIAPVVDAITFFLLSGTGEAMSMVSTALASRERESALSQKLDGKRFLNWKFSPMNQ